jgi:hypothetical protein
LPGGEGGGGSIFWKTRDIGLPSYSNYLSMVWSHPLLTLSFVTETRLGWRNPAWGLITVWQLWTEKVTFQLKRGFLGPKRVAFEQKSHLFSVHIFYSSVLPTGRLFSRISHKGPFKRWSGWTNLRPNFGRFWTKRAEKGLNFKDIVSLLVFSLILGKSEQFSQSHRQK